MKENFDKKVTGVAATMSGYNACCFLNKKDGLFLQSVFFLQINPIFMNYLILLYNHLNTLLEPKFSTESISEV